ncbi:putative prophage protein, partial [Streptococcus pneumoniae]
MPILLLYSMSGLIIAAIVPVTKSMISIETISARAYKTKPSSVCTTLLRKLK